MATAAKIGQRPLETTHLRGMILLHHLRLPILATLFAVFASQASAMFIQADQMNPTEPGVGTNRYAYSFGDPVNRSDPSGYASVYHSDGTASHIKPGSPEHDAHDAYVAGYRGEFATGRDLQVFLQSGGYSGVSIQSTESGDYYAGYDPRFELVSQPAQGPVSLPGPTGPPQIKPRNWLQALILGLTGQLKREPKDYAWHYSYKSRIESIVGTGIMKPSIETPGTRDARLGSGVYFTRIDPLTTQLSRGQIAYRLWGDGRLARRAEAFVTVNIHGFPRVTGGLNLVVPTTRPLNVNGRIAGWGETPRNPRHQP